MVQINIRNESSYDLKEYYSLFQEIAKYTLKQFQMKGNIEFSVTFVSKNKIQEINRVYRKIDRVTDVISFENDDGFEVYDGFMTLGDIFICPSRAKKQAKDYGHSMYREICFLFTHGLLHLLKMDHVYKQDEEEMFMMQDKIMNHFKIVR